MTARKKETKQKPHSESSIGADLLSSPAPKSQAASDSPQRTETQTLDSPFDSPFARAQPHRSLPRKLGFQDSSPSVESTPTTTPTQATPWVKTPTKTSTWSQGEFTASDFFKNFKYGQRHLVYGLNIDGGRRKYVMALEKVWMERSTVAGSTLMSHPYKQPTIDRLNNHILPYIKLGRLPVPQREDPDLVNHFRFAKAFYKTMGSQGLSDDSDIIGNLCLAALHNPYFPQIHFVVDKIDIQRVASGIRRKDWRDITDGFTTKEMRHLYLRPKLLAQVSFFYKGKQQAPPWISHKQVWKEFYNTDEERDAYLRGFTVGMRFNGQINKLKTLYKPVTDRDYLKYKAGVNEGYRCERARLARGVTPNKTGRVSTSRHESKRSPELKQSLAYQSPVPSFALSTKANSNINTSSPLLLQESFLRSDSEEESFEERDESAKPIKPS